MNALRIMLPIAVVVCAVLSASAQENRTTPAGAASALKRLDFASEELIMRQQRHLSCSYRTLARRLRHADFSLIVEIRRQANAEKDVPRKVQVRHVMKPSSFAKIDIDDILQIPLDGNEDQTKFALVFCAFEPSKRLGITEIQWIGKDEVSYYSKLAGQANEQSRVWFLLETEASDNRSVSLDARAELEALSAADIKRAAGKRLREFVLHRLGEPTLDASQRHFYMMLLGHAGKAEDVNELAQYVFPNPDGDASYLWTASEAYLRLGDAAAKKRFVEHFFTDLPPLTRSEAERNAQGARLLAPYLAMLEVSPALEKQAKVGEYLIEHSVLADFVLSNALAKGEQRFATLAIETYNCKDVEPLVRREAIIYAAGMLELEKKRGNRERIERFLALVGNSEPEMHRQALESLHRRRMFFEWAQ